MAMRSADKYQLLLCLAVLRADGMVCEMVCEMASEVAMLAAMKAMVRHHLHLLEVHRHLKPEILSAGLSFVFFLILGMLRRLVR